MGEIKACFKDDSGKDAKGSDAIFPIIKQSGDGSFEFLATAFGITRYGLLATAKHVPFIDEQTVYRYLFAIHFYKDGSFFLRQIRSIAWHGTGDVAIVLLEPMKHKESGEPLHNKVMTLTTDIPKENSHIATFAYPLTRITKTSEGQSINIQTNWYHGEVVNYFSNGRDKTFLPGRCYSTTLGFPGGASGGPVADDKGRVFAVNSTSLSVDGGYSDAYVSSILDLLEIEVPDGDGNKFKISKLVGENKIAVG